MRLHRNYLIVFLCILCIEIFIALCIKQSFIRHTLGDVLVVIMLYFFFKGVSKIKPFSIAFIVLVIAYSIELIQIIDIHNVMGVEKTTVTSIIFGTTFSVSDLIAYTIGVFIALISDKKSGIIAKFSH